VCIVQSVPETGHSDKKFIVWSKTAMIVEISLVVLTKAQLEGGVARGANVPPKLLQPKNIFSY